MSFVRIPTPATRMGPLDAAFLYADREEAPLHVGCLARLHHTPAPDHVLASLQEVSARVPRLAQRIAWPRLGLTHPTWEDQPSFEVEQQVRHWQVRPPGGETELRELVEFLVAVPLDRARPLWEIHLIEGLEQERAAVLFKAHHCMLDGTSGTALLQALVERGGARSKRTSQRLVTLEPPSPIGCVTRELAAAIGVPARAALRAVGSLREPSRMRRNVGAACRLAGSVCEQRLAKRPSPLRTPGGRGRQLRFAALPLPDLHSARSTHGATVNDVLVSTLSGGLRRYFRALGVPTGPAWSVEALVPVCARPPEEGRTLGNQLSMVLWPLALQPRCEGQRLALTRATASRWKNGNPIEGARMLVGALDLVPAWILSLGMRNLPVPLTADLLITNLRGPEAPMRLFGAPVESLHPIAPIAGGMGLSVAALSYAGRLHLSFQASGSLLDLGLLCDGVGESFQALVEWSHRGIGQAKGGRIR